jgi:hypothetical protein
LKSGMKLLLLYYTIEIVIFFFRKIKALVLRQPLNHSARICPLFPTRPRTRSKPHSPNSPFLFLTFSRPEPSLKNEGFPEKRRSPVTGRFLRLQSPAPGG